MLDKFWQWYNRHYALNVSVAAGLFAVQLVHLFWLTTNVVIARIAGEAIFQFSGIWEVFIVLVDYTEIPAIVAASLVYFHELQRGGGMKNAWYLVLINSQWLHLSWITDEFVIRHFFEHRPEHGILPVWLAWIAIMIDYLELPVIVDTITKAVTAFRKTRSNEQ